MTPPTTTYEFGDVLLVPFPFTDQSAGKQRPAVVVSSADYSQERPDLIILAVTSRIKPNLGIGEALIAQWKRAGLIKPGLFKPVLTTIEKGLIVKKLGRLVAADKEKLRGVLNTILG
jgi:mRNA interferase MazF